MEKRELQDQDREPAFPEFLAGYFVTLAAVVCGALLAEEYLDLEPYRGMVLSVSLLYLLAALAYPGWLFQIVRRVRWFGAIESDGAMRVVLIVLGLVLLLVFAAWSSLAGLILKLDA